ncbi:Protein lin-28 homolog [Eumeta japonica]|uniref:Protein lin-28 homolog n=1 Tax=Eumeta variegata TaxID=151549 RepID=A0A4C1TJM6_EUMVA|nr:Protein lin-28 homolog [Eumeta japonica]
MTPFLRLHCRRGPGPCSACRKKSERKKRKKVGIASSHWTSDSDLDLAPNRDSGSAPDSPLDLVFVSYPVYDFHLHSDCCHALDFTPRPKTGHNSRRNSLIGDRRQRRYADGRLGPLLLRLLQRATQRQDAGAIKQMLPESKATTRRSVRVREVVAYLAVDPIVRALSVIQMPGFRSLGDDEVVEFECKESEKGLEATRVSGPSSIDCQGSHRRPMSKKRFRKIRCYNCGEFANHIAAKCTIGPQPKRCHNCKSEDHLIADCPIKIEKKKDDQQSKGSGSSQDSSSQQSSPSKHP